MGWSQQSKTWNAETERDTAKGWIVAVETEQSLPDTMHAALYPDGSPAEVVLAGTLLGSAKRTQGPGNEQTYEVTFPKLPATGTYQLIMGWKNGEAPGYGPGQYEAVDSSDPSGLFTFPRAEP